LKIKSKLVMLILSLIAAVIFAITIFVLLQFNINKLNKEKQYFIELEKALENELLELATLVFPSALYKSQLKVYELSLEEKKKAMENLSNIKSLPKISGKIKSAINAIKQLDNMQSSSLKKFFETSVSFIEIGEQVMVYSNDFSLDDINSTVALNSDLYQNFRFHGKTLESNIVLMAGVLESSKMVLSNQYKVVDLETKNLTRKSFMITGILIAISLLVAIFIAIKISRKIVISINSIEDNVSVMVKR